MQAYASAKNIHVVLSLALTRLMMEWLRLMP